MKESTESVRGRALPWDEVKDGAEAVFRVWHLGSEEEWAERAWAMLEKAGLTTYHGAVEETRVRVRLLALASIYWDFCRLGADESGGWDELHVHGVENLGIREFRLGQIVGPGFDLDDYDSEGWEFAESALSHLIREERPAIGPALIKGHGGAQALMDSLFASMTIATEPDDDDDPPELRDRPRLHNVAPVMGWIMEGMPCI
jgi:hypothetical protein